MAKLSTYTNITSPPSDTDQVPITTGGITKNITTGLLTRKPYVTVGTSYSDYITDGTADDVQIQAAIDAVTASGGGTVLIRKGIYDINATVQLKPNTSIIGDGWTTILKSKASLNSFPLRAQYSNLVDNVILRDFKVDMNGPNQSSNGWVAITGATNMTLDHVWFYNSRTFALLAQPDGDAISGNHCTNWLVNNCRFDTQSSPTADLAILNIRHSRIVNNYWGQGPSTISPSYALSAGRSMRHTVIANNVFKGTNMSSIALEDIQDCIIIGNRIEGSGTHGIFIPTFEPTFNVERVTISNNIITGSGDSGIALGGGSGDGRIKNSIITGNICYNNGQDGIRLQGNDNCIINGNICFNNNQDANITPTGSGIRFSGGTPLYNLITNNQCFDDQGSPTQNYGIYSASGDHQLTAHNRTSGNITGGVSVSGASSTTDTNIT